MEGNGFLDIIKNPKSLFIRQDSYNNKTRKNLEMWGNLIIQELYIARTPINKNIDKLLNLLSLGKYEKAKKHANYDNLFHLSLIARISDKKQLIIEKNEVINVDTKYKIESDTETLKIDLKDKKFTTNQLLNETLERIGNKKFYLYHPFEANCQIFLRDLLTTVNLYGEKENDFIYQDLTELRKKIPKLTQFIMKLTTDAGAAKDKLMGGQEQQEQQEPKKKRGRPRTKEPKPVKPKRVKVLKPWFKIEEPPKGFRRGSMEEALQKKKVFYWGIKKIDDKILQAFKPKETKEDLIKLLAGLTGKLSKLKKDILQEKDAENKKNMIEQFNKSRDELLKINERYKKLTKT